MSGQIHVEQDGFVATVRIDNPHKRNALNQAMWIALGDALDELAADAGLGCLEIRGAGDLWISGGGVSALRRGLSVACP